MKKLLVLAVAVIALAGCKMPLFDFPIPDLGLTSVDEVLRWTANNVYYQHDQVMHYPRTEYWQSPYQTYIWRTGDCEDFAILAMYLLKRDAGVTPRMAISTDHAWVEIDGLWYEPQHGTRISTGQYDLRKYISYEEVIRRSTTTHRTITEE